MARKPRVLLAGGIYHITSRGNDRRLIFKTDDDRRRFLERLSESAQTYEVRIYLYCLMGNHIHLLLETPHPNLDRFMGSLLTGYTVYFNLRHNRAGHLMQGRYNAQLVQGTEYLLKLSRYIHLNPVHIKEWAGKPLPERLAHLRRYPWSSFPEYAGTAKPCGFLSTEPILGLMVQFGRGRETTRYRKYIETGLAQSDEEFTNLMGEKGVAIGSSAFIGEVKELHRQAAEERNRPEDVSIRQLRTFRDAQEVTRAVETVLGISDLQSLSPRAYSTERGFLAWALQHFAGLTQREVSPYLNVQTGATVCLAIKRFDAAETCEEWKKRLRLIFKG
ncbi:MAG: transposase [Kiritimatiellae bacterium]|nr:transposase [Kiritimatiellia bacterium]